MNIAVLVSGSGTNLQALIDADVAGDLSPARLRLVISNRPGVTALTRAESAGIPHHVVDHTAFASRTTFEDALMDRLRESEVEAVILAGFMRVLTNTFVDEFPHRIINTHPALCPAFPGMHAVSQALAHGVKVTGCTIHFVDSGVDTGPIIFQSAVPVQDDDTEDSLVQRIQREEHRLLPRAVKLLATGDLSVRARRVLGASL